MYLHYYILPEFDQLLTCAVTVTVRIPYTSIYKITINSEKTTPLYEPSFQPTFLPDGLGTRNFQFSILFVMFAESTRLEDQASVEE